MLMPMISVEDLDAVRTYYTDSLGFHEDFMMNGPDGNLFTVSLRFGDAPLMFSVPIEGKCLNPDGLMLYFSTEEVDALHARLSHQDGVEIAEGLVDQFWGDRTFIVSDPWGLHLMFGQTVNEMAAPPEGFEVEMAQPTG